jgi:hypothetical protein
VNMPENPYAFPSADERDDNGCGIRQGSPGMDLRDYFAAQCDVSAYFPAKAYQDANGRAPRIDELAKYIAAIRFIEADAMLAARTKGTPA